MLLRQFAIAALITAGLSAALLTHEFHAYSSDAGQHYALVRSFMDSHGWIRSTADSNLGALLLSYPPVSHWLAAEAGALFGSGLIGMAVVASACVGLFYLSMFVLSFEINWRAPVIAGVMTIGYAVLRGPVFGRQVVNNYFFSQVVGSAIAMLVLVVVRYKFRKWNGLLLDFLVLVAGQLLVATNLLPAAQLLSAYCVILLVHAWAESNWQIMARLALFSGASLALTFLNPHASTFYAIAQFNGGAHINLFGNRLAQLVLLAAGIAASARLILRGIRDQGAAMFLGCITLACCGLALLQILLYWAGFGSNYAIAKHMFLVVALFIFAFAANLALNRAQPSDANRPVSPAMALAWCSVLALLTTRLDLYPSVMNLGEVVKFQRAVRAAAARLPNPDGRRPIALASAWPVNVAYGITIGDLRFPEPVAELILNHKPLPADQVSVVFMPAGDPLLAPQCLVEAASNGTAAALDYGCFLGSGKSMP